MLHARSCTCLASPVLCLVQLGVLEGYGQKPPLHSAVQSFDFVLSSRAALCRNWLWHNCGRQSLEGKVVSTERRLNAIRATVGVCISDHWRHRDTFYCARSHARHPFVTWARPLHDPCRWVPYRAWLWRQVRKYPPFPPPRLPPHSLVEQMGRWWRNPNAATVL
jgi:hypothetical protein